DEPTVSLDVQSTGLLAGVIESHLATGGLVVAATHLPLGLANARELKLGAKPTAAPSGGEALG
ncbi:MAG: heme ABC transporter ATP-binding protein CcmA, partial [Hyphomicrobiaceae bacterium]